MKDNIMKLTMFKYDFEMCARMSCHQAKIYFAECSYSNFSHLCLCDNEKTCVNNFCIFSMSQNTPVLFLYFYLNLDNSYTSRYSNFFGCTRTFVYDAFVYYP